MDEDQIINLYWSRQEEAIAETDKKYGAFCRQIAFHILYDREDSEECVNDTYFNAWNTIPPKRPEKLSTFLGKITRNLALSRYRRDHARKRGGGEVPLALEKLESCIPGGKNPEEIIVGKQLTQMLNRFLKELDRENRIIFLQRYWMLRPVKEIACLYGMSESKVKMSLLRTRNKLRTYLIREEMIL